MYRILLVEDDKSIVSNLTEFLTSEGYEIKSASGQSAALKLIEEEVFDLALLDVSLADGNGFALCSAIKKDYNLPVIFLTASGDEYSTITGFELGADDYIAKPFRPRELATRMLNTETNELTSFTFMFCDPSNQPELGNIIAFTDNVFDESLWQDESWLYGYQFARYQLDEGKGYDNMLVYRGSTLEDALNMRKSIKEDWGVWDKSATVNMYDFKTDAAKEAMAYIQPFENGVFVPLSNFSGLKYYRYIGGCPTNEWIMIDNLDTEEVTRSEYSFEDGDFENLPDIAAYIETLDLTTLKPQHIDTTGKDLLFNSAIGWYEKTATDVYSIVRISWRYCDDDEWYVQYYDESFIILGDDGAEVVTREELISLIGENQNIYEGEYGVGVLLPQ